MAAKRSPPFRAEHCGSLLRPQELVQKRYDVAAGKATQAELEPLEDKSIEEVVKLQKDCGLSVVSSGEYARHMFWGTFFETLNGMKELQLGVLKGYDASIFRPYAPDVKSFMEAKEVPNAVTVCTGKISHPGVSSYQREVDIMKKLVPEKDWGNIKITMISPSWYHFRYKAGRSFPKEVYANDEEYFEDVAAAYQTELGILHGLGIRNIQIDDPNLAYFCSDAMLEGWAADSDNTKTADEMLDAYVKFYNKCFQRPDDMHLGIHLCRGNYVGSRHFSEGAYDNIAKKLFQDLNVDTYYLEYDTPRAGGFEPLAHLPKNKNVVLGVITSKFPKLEDKDEMIGRINQAGEIIAKASGQTKEEALQRVCVSPQCGFASHAEGNELGYEDMRKKLQLVRGIADAVWPGEP
ncbi:5-methyltetrahydropteroyltriglutamate-homocysteine methyltransferase [Amniculicola lignicola CBS 123094]|uniref:5-methyltetrahydropteroyltriglutamate-homocysteine methyltransferase n=1 Tax=Amniculicola lignicola CBS 123094 TaxID=1392246 RepID=A0A6A5WF95_9PLEO|nr:5-methyltetrahydropteroyltriglutamate-homocysteine methyltransferase [Amniculicola lignicola CBS 123094]